MPAVRPRGSTFQALARVKKNGVIIFQESRNFNSERLALDWARKMEDSVRKNGAPDTRTSEKTLMSLLYDYLIDLERVRAVPHQGRRVQCPSAR